MNEKDFANMSTQELQAYCENLQKELDKALWFLRQKRLKEEQDVSVE